MFSLSRRTLFKLTTGALLFAMLPKPPAKECRFNWNRRVLHAERKGETARAIYYKKHQMARYRPYVQTASR
jgi:hypothetical protein